MIKDRWSRLSDILSLDVLRYARKQIRELQDMEEWSDEEIWQAIVAERGQDDVADGQISTFDLKSEEWELFTNPATVVSSELLRMEEVPIPHGYNRVISQVVLMKKLREVSALIGFTRIISPGDYADIDEIPDIRRVRLSRKATDWVPASEVNGEGIFIRLREDAILDWLSAKPVKDKSRAFAMAHGAFRKTRKVPNPAANFPGIRYALLHSLAHALIRQLSIECGYGAASIRERIYSSDGVNDQPMAGILLYTAAPDSEGTLGGLVALGQQDAGS